MSKRQLSLYKESSSPTLREFLRSSKALLLEDLRLRIAPLRPEIAHSLLDYSTIICKAPEYSLPLLSYILAVNLQDDDHVNDPTKIPHERRPTGRCRSGILGRSSKLFPIPSGFKCTNKRSANQESMQRHQPSFQVVFLRSSTKNSATNSSTMTQSIPTRTLCQPPTPTTVA